MAELAIIELWCLGLFSCLSRSGARSAILSDSDYPPVLYVVVTDYMIDDLYLCLCCTISYLQRPMRFTCAVKRKQDLASF